jgi:hypothetical protein
VKISKDKIGLYVQAGGWKSRPFHKTRFKEGDDIKTHHFGGTCVAGIGKDENCKKGQYLEYWCACGSYKYLTETEELEKYNWYKTNCFDEVDAMVQGRGKKGAEEEQLKMSIKFWGKVERSLDH